jgi:predicted regulator of Ras-like GTPase activity (Roadblock/LC7/MglB family)
LLLGLIVGGRTMDIALDQYLTSNPNITGSIVADSNGLLVTGEHCLFSLFSSVSVPDWFVVSAKGDLSRNAEIKAGLYTSISRLAQSLPSPTATLNEGVVVAIETVSHKQILVRKVGEFTVAVQSED